MSDLHDARVEAAAKAVREVDARAGLIADVDLPMYRARAALVAAAGAAPQAESEHEYLLKARELHQTNSGLPSSTVDEAALIREAKAEALTDAVAMVSDEEHAFVHSEWGTVVPKLTIIKALRTRAAEYREGSDSRGHR